MLLMFEISLLRESVLPGSRAKRGPAFSLPAHVIAGGLISVCASWAAFDLGLRGVAFSSPCDQDAAPLIPRALIAGLVAALESGLHGSCATCKNSRDISLGLALGHRR
jgi:hypothetical protein